LVLDGGDCLPGINGRAVKDPSFGLDALWVALESRADAISAGYTVVDAPTVIATQLNQIVTASACELFGLDEAQALINALKDAYPQLAQGLTPVPYSLSAITALCRALLAERIPLKDFRRIAEALVTASGVDLTGKDNDPAALVEAVRQRIGGLIIQTIVPVGMPLPAVTFDGGLESLLVQAVRAGPGAVWPFEPALASRIIDAVRDAVQPMLMTARSFAIITSPVCRAAVARLLRAHMADVPVLSFLEIPETKSVDVAAVVAGQPQHDALAFSQTDMQDNGEY
jgi:flagellar biosynthesis protein FlhA